MQNYGTLRRFPLSSQQMGIYFECIKRQGEAVYNLPYLYHLDSDVDMERLAHAWRLAIDMHGSVKTRIAGDETGEPVAIVDNDLQPNVKEVSFTQREWFVERERLVEPFDLQGDDDLYRVRLISITDDEGDEVVDKYMFYDFHHIICDGTSRMVLLACAEDIYTNGPAAREVLTAPQLAEREGRLPLDEAERWHSSLLEDVEGSTIPLPDLIGDEQTRLAHATLPLDVTAADLSDFRSRRGFAAGVVTTAAMGLLLGKYTNARNAVFATIYSGRNRKELEATVGMLVKTLPMVCRWDKGMSVDQYLRQARENLYGARDYSIEGFASLAERYGVSADVLFAYQGRINPQNNSSRLADSVQKLDVGATGAPLTLEVMDLGAGGLQLKCEYHANRYSERFITQLMSAYELALSGLLRCERLDEIGIADDEQLAIIDARNRASEVDYDRDATVVSLFRRAVDSYPSNVAVSFGNTQIDYATLYDTCRRLAERIVTMGVGRGEVVSVLVPRGEYMAIAGMGALLAGCAYQPLDASYPPERLSFMLADASSALLITTPELHNLVADFAGKVIFTDDIASLPSEDVVLPEVYPDDLYTLLYTSGSTGTPKGVRLLHRNLVAFVHSHSRRVGISESDVIGCYASFGFDACMMDMTVALTTGATLCIIPEEIRLDLDAVDRYLKKNGVTVQFMTTQVGRQYAMDYDVSHLRVLMVGGEKLVPMPAPACDFYNIYGPTETTVYVTCHLLTDGESDVPIGSAVDNTRLYVVDADGHQLPDGAVGELWIAGEQVGAGYLNRPEKTAEVFIKNPFCDEIGYQHVYRTGDDVRFLPTGEVQFVGRSDGQVKIRGFRVELTEVEAVIREFPDIADATVAAFDATGGGKFIAAYVVSDKEIDIDELNSFIAERKPPYMIPEVTMQIEKIPLTQNQKVNRRALPKPERRIAEVADDTSRELNKLELELSDIISQVVNSEVVPLSTQLIYLGLTSIASIKLSTLLFRRFGVNIKSQQLMNGTLMSIENEILTHFMSAKDTPTATTTRTKRSTVRSVPLSHAQLGVYYDCMKRPADILYNIPSILLFDKEVEADALVSAAQAFATRHPELMIHIEMRDDNVMQVADGGTIDVPVKEMTDDELQQFKKDFVKPFNLSRGPLYRATVVKTPTAIALLTDFHHLAMDGASMTIFLDEIKRSLAGEHIEDEQYSYFEHVLDEQEAEGSQDYYDNAQFFKEMLSDCESASELTSDTGVKGGDGAIARVSEPLDLKRMETFAQANGVTVAALALAATFYTTGRYVNSHDVFLSTISGGRGDVRNASTVGMFVNTLPLGMTMGENETVLEYIKSANILFADTIAHESYPFSRIAADFGYEPNIVYEYQLGVIDGLDIPHLLKRESLEGNQAKFKLAVHIENDENGLPAVVLNYNDTLYTAKLMRHYARSIVIALTHMLDDPRQLIRRVSLIDDERERQLAGFRQVATANIPMKLYHEGMERHAALSPEKLALVTCDGRFSFQELDENANRIANALIERGVEQHARVALLLPRTSRVIFALYGTLKAGCTYIPCDPTYPVERVNHIINDSGAALIITTADLVGDYPSGRAIDVEELLQCANIDKPAVAINPKDLAYMIYTSGSTGVPKGVMLRHLGAANYHTCHPANVMVDALASEVTTFLSVTTLSFDMSIKEIATPLFNGLTVVLADESQVNDPMKLAALMRKNGVDAVNCTHSRLYQYMELPEYCDALSRCKLVMSGGEKYTEGLLPLLKQVTKARIFNTYGPTETTISCNIKELTHEDTISVGRPQLNVKEFVVDSDGNELPEGVVGELYIGGDGVAVGYNNLEKMNSERFVDYKWIRVYKSGDYARWTPEGDVVILGRTDNQIKLRGLRIELGEVESVLRKVDGIKNVVVKINRIKGGEHLCAYFTADRSIDIGQLKEELKKSLAHYMVPTAYKQLERMPLTPNGKTDIKSLPEADLFLSGNGEKAANKTEQTFCDIFSDVLTIEGVGATDNFFELGGTSLTVTRVIIEANKAKLNINYGDVFTNPTPRQLAALVGESGVVKGQDTDDEIENYDYSRLDAVLEANNLDNFLNGNHQPLGDVLLTGATGFLGIHILEQLLHATDGNIYCLLRGRGSMTAERRLKAQLFYYFENTFDDMSGSRLKVIEGDITRELDNLPQVDTVINCAAVVKHFSKGTEIEDVNVGGVDNLIEWCLAHDARLVHVSTLSTVSFARADRQPAGDVNEKTLYFRQFISNKYVHSKFLAERHIIEAIAERGLSAKIMRVGNLSARYRDGEFQINYGTNSFMGRLKSYAIIGKCPFSMLDTPMEFSPIDDVAAAIVTLSETPRECCIFHPFNHHRILSVDIFNEMTRNGLDVVPVETEEYQRALADAGEDPAKAKVLSSMIAYQNMGHDVATLPVVRHNEYTMQVLYRMGYKWHITTWDYVKRFLNQLQGLGFFELND